MQSQLPKVSARARFVRVTPLIVFFPKMNVSAIKNLGIIYFTR